MPSSAELAQATATIFGLQPTDLDLTAFTPSTSQDNLDPGAQTAVQLWLALQSHTSDDSDLTDAVRALAQSPSESSRTTLQDAILSIIEAHDSLLDELTTIIQQSPYATLLGAPPDTQTQAIRRTAASQQRNRTLGILLGITVAFFLLSGLITRLGLTPLIFLLLITRGILYGYFADDLKIKRPVLLGIFAALPGSILSLLLSLSGHRTDADDSVSYTRSVRIIYVAIACIPAVIFLFLLLINPRYVMLLTRNTFGLGLSALLLASLAIMGTTIWFAYWKGEAQTGLGIGLASFLIGICFPIALWVTILGPAAVQIREQFGNDIFEILFEGM